MQGDHIQLLKFADENWGVGKLQGTPGGIFSRLVRFLENFKVEDIAEIQSYLNFLYVPFKMALELEIF